MRISIIGPGAVGGFFAAGLVQAGHEVELVARGRSLEMLRTRGLQVYRSATDSTEIVQVPGVTQVGEYFGQKPDVIFHATKAGALVETLQALAANPLAQGVPVALTQNAVEAPDIAAEILGAEHILAGVVRGFFHHLGPAELSHAGGPSSYQVGALVENSPAAAVVPGLVDALESAGISATVEDNPMGAVWEKAMFVSCFGVLGAATDYRDGSGKVVSPGLQVVRGTYRDTFIALMKEMLNTARAHGVSLDDGAITRVLNFADHMPAEATSSMQRDIAAGLEGELEAQLGAISRIAKQHGVDVRLHDFFYTYLQEQLQRSS